MILVTVGTQLPFERLLRAVHAITTGTHIEVIAQSHSIPAWDTHMQCFASLPPDALDEYFSRAEVIVSHAGVGSIISARRAGKPIIIYPRLSKLGEHRNDHQLATARQLGSETGIHVAWDESDLRELIHSRSELSCSNGLGPEHETLISNLKTLIKAA